MTNIEKVEEGLRICTSAEPCNDCPYLTERDCNLAMVHDAMMLLKKVLMKKQPEIVRCGDCKYLDKYGPTEHQIMYCKKMNDLGCFNGLTENWFCADGERRTK